MANRQTDCMRRATVGDCNSAESRAPLVPLLACPAVVEEPAMLSPGAHCRRSIVVAQYRQSTHRPAGTSRCASYELASVTPACSGRCTLIPSVPLRRQLCCRTQRHQRNRAASQAPASVAACYKYDGRRANGREATKEENTAAETHRRRNVQACEPSARQTEKLKADQQRSAGRSCERIHPISPGFRS